MAINKKQNTIKNKLIVFQNKIKSLTDQILTKSMDESAGLETVLQNPDVLINDKGKTLQIYDTMMLDDRINSIINLFKRMVLSVSNSIVPASGNSKDIEITEFIKWMFANMQISHMDILDNFLDAKIYGFKVAELIWDNAKTAAQKGIHVPNIYQDKWFITKYKHKHSIFFDFEYDEFGNLKSLYISRNYGDAKIINDLEEIKNKFTIFVNPYIKDGNYYGKSDLQSIYTQYYAKFYIFRYRNQYLEKFGAPIPEVIYDKGITNSSEVSNLEDMLKNFQDSMFFINPGRWNNDKADLIGKFKFIMHEARNSRATSQFEEAINQIDTQISRSLLLPDKMGFSDSDGGSYALGKTQFNILINIIENTHRRLENLVNSDIKKVIDLNYANVENYPHFEFDKLSNSIEKDMLELLITKGIVNPNEKWIRSWTGIPELTEKEREEIESDNNEKENETIKQQQPEVKDNIENEDEKPLTEDIEKANKKIINKLFLQKFQQKKNDMSGLPVNVKKIDRTYLMAENDFIRDFSRIYMDNVASLIKQINSKKIIDTEKLSEIEKLRIKKTDLKRLLNEYYNKLYFNGKTDAIEEIEKRLNKVKKKFKIGKIEGIIFQNNEEDWLDKQWIESHLDEYGELGIFTQADADAFSLAKQRAFFITGTTEDSMIKEVGNIIYSGLKSGETGKNIIIKIEKKLTEDLQRYASTIARTNASDFYNSGRLNFFEDKAVSPVIEAYMYSAIIDDRTTPFCEHHDGQIIQKGDSQVSLINPPNHFNCRSFLTPILITEKDDPDNFFYNYSDRFQEWDEGVAGSIRPAEGFGK